MISYLLTDLHWVEEAAKLSQQSLPHVVSTTRVGQNQYRSPAIPTVHRKLQTKYDHDHSVALTTKKQTKKKQTLEHHARGDACTTAACAHNTPTFLYSSACLRRSLLTW